MRVKGWLHYNTSVFTQLTHYFCAMFTLQMYKRHDPSSVEEIEFMENLFNSLCSALMLPANRERFLRGEGIQLMNLMLRFVYLSYHYYYEPFLRCSTCVDLVENCKKSTSIHFFVSQESQVKTEKQNGYMYSSCSIALIANYRPTHKIEQTMTGAISVIRQTASAGDCSD